MRHEKTFPREDGFQFEFTKYMWEQGWFDEFSEEHFFIKAIKNTLSDFKYIDYYRNNISFISIPGVNYNSIHDMNMFNDIFVTNFSFRLKTLCELFGESKIKKFVKDQLSAGKSNYDENKFFQAVSEVSILVFISSSVLVTKNSYEPVAGEKNLGNSKKNPEASFECAWSWTIDENDNEIPTKIYKLNVEVKTPMFHSPKNSMLCIPGVLLTQDGIQKLKAYCETVGITYRNPGIGKLVDFIKSAISKFNYPQENELNILYINWSQSDFPSNGYLEAWSLLTNPYNGLLTNEYVMTQFGINKNELEKISAIIVYTEDLEGFMFSDFRYTWKTDPKWGTKFRIWIRDKRQRVDNGLIFHLTHMNPTPFEYIPALVSIGKSDKIENDNDKAKICNEIQKIIEDNKFSRCIIVKKIKRIIMVLLKFFKH